MKKEEETLDTVILEKKLKKKKAPKKKSSKKTSSTGFFSLKGLSLGASKETTQPRKTLEKKVSLFKKEFSFEDSPHSSTMQDTLNEETEEEYLKKDREDFLETFDSDNNIEYTSRDSNEIEEFENELYRPSKGTDDIITRRENPYALTTVSKTFSPEDFYRHTQEKKTIPSNQLSNQDTRQTEPYTARAPQDGSARMGQKKMRRGRFN